MALVSKQYYAALVELVSKKNYIPEVFRDLVKRIHTEKAENPNMTIKDGYKVFRRSNADKSRAVLYTLYCTNLNNPSLNAMEKASIDK